jgi:hypothetical protein
MPTVYFNKLYHPAAAGINMARLLYLQKRKTLVIV